MAKLGLKFTLAIELFLSLSIFVCTSASNVEPVCHDVQQGGNPIADQRLSSTFFGATQSSCQSGNPEFYVTNAELFQEIQFSEETDFCPTHADQNSSEEERICDQDNLFRFAEHSDRLPLFIEQSSQFLTNIPLPISFNESTLSDEEKLHYQAIIYFCTRTFAQPLINKINSSTLPIDERLAAFNELKSAGLLHLFSTDALRLVRNPELDIQLRRQILFGFLDQGTLAEPFVNLMQKANRTVTQINERAQGNQLSPRMMEELQRQGAVISSLEELLNEYVEAEHRPEQLAALQLLAGIEIQGADSAALILERSISSGSRAQSVSAAAIPLQTVNPAATNVVHNRPACSANTSAIISSADYTIIEQLVFTHTSEITRQSIDFSQNFIGLFNSDSQWTNLVLAAPEQLELFEKFYCFQKNIQNALGNIDQLSTAEADRISQQIQSIPGSISNLRALATLLPALSRSEYLTALNSFGTSSNNMLEVDEFKAQVLFDEFQRITNSGSNLSDTELTGAIIGALGSNSGFAADQKLSEIFQNNSDESLRMSIIQAYANPTFARFGSRLNIFHTLFEFSPEERSPYAQALATIVQENYTTLQSNGGANNSSGSLAASEGQVNAALAAVMALNSDRTGNLNDGLEDVLTSDGETRLRTGRAPIVQEQSRLLRLEDPDIREQTQRALVAANAAANIPENTGNSNPFEAFNQILEDQRSPAQESDQDFIPDAEYLARVTGENRQRDRIDNSGQNESSALEVSNSDEYETPFIPVSPDSQSSSSSRDTSSFVDPLSPNSAADSFNPVTNTQSQSPASPFIGSNSQDLQNEIDSLKEQNSQLIGSIERDDFETGRLSSSTATQARANTVARGSITSSAQQGTGRSIASVSAPSVQAQLPSSVNTAAASPKNSSSATSASEQRKNEQITAPLSEPLLSPRQEINSNEKGRVIKIVDNEQKLKFLDYMSTRNQFSCEELTFIKSFYSDNLSYFFIKTQDNITTQFANVEIDQMTYRFDYPGDTYVAQAQQKSCTNNKEETTANQVIPNENRTPASVTTPNEEDERTLQEEVIPQRRESIQDLLFNKFKEKFGL